MNENINQTTEQQSTTPTPEASGDQGGERLFTQRDLDRVVGERLARAKRDTDTDKRAAALEARENRLTCREFLSDKQYPVELLDILDTSDAKVFQSNVERLSKLFQNTELAGPVVRVDLAAPLTSNPGRSTDAIANAFKPPKI